MKYNYTYTYNFFHFFFRSTTKQRTAQLNVLKFTDNQHQAEFREENCNRPKHTVIN